MPQKLVEPEMVMRGIDGYRFCCLEVDEKMIAASYSNQNIIQVWDIVTGELLSTLSDHTEKILDIKIVGHFKLASCGFDKTIKVWNCKTGECLMSLEGHKSSIKCIHPHPTDETRLVSSGFVDRMIKIWCINTGRCLKTMRKHTGRINTVQYFHDKNDQLFIVSGSSDKSFKVWDPEEDILIHSIDGEGHVTEIKINCCEYTQGIILYNNGYTKVFNFDSGEFLYTVDYLQQIQKIATCEIKDNMLFQGNGNGKIFIWDLIQKKQINYLDNNKYVSKHRYINGIHLYKNFIISTSEDGVVNLWNFKTGTFVKNLVPPSKEWMTLYTSKINCNKLVFPMEWNQVCGNNVLSSQDTKIFVYDLEAVVEETNKEKSK